jgi:hypothetical protein
MESNENYFYEEFKPINFKINCVSGDDYIKITMNIKDKEKYSLIDIKSHYEDKENNKNKHYSKSPKYMICESIKVSINQLLNEFLHAELL